MERCTYLYNTANPIFWFSISKREKRKKQRYKNRRSIKANTAKYAAKKETQFNKFTVHWWFMVHVLGVNKSNRIYSKSNSRLFNLSKRLCKKFCMQNDVWITYVTPYRALCATLLCFCSLRVIFVYKCHQFLYSLHITCRHTIFVYFFFIRKMLFSVFFV